MASDFEEFYHFCAEFVCATICVREVDCGVDIVVVHIIIIQTLVSEEEFGDFRIVFEDEQKLFGSEGVSVGDSVLVVDVKDVGGQVVCDGEVVV